MTDHLPTRDLDAIEAEVASLRESIEQLASAVHQKDLAINRLENRLAAHEPLTDRPASLVNPNGSTRESWLQTRLEGGAGYKCRDAGRKILSLVPADQRPAERAQVVEALHELVDEISRWSNAWSSTTVDMDHKVRDASKRALDCDEHGKVIAGLEEQLTHFDKAAQRSEKGRLVMVDGVFRLEQAIDRLEVARTLGREISTEQELIPALRSALTKLHAAHQRAWK
jgi:chromosome segregation ATPase